jgi:hypothetical protein
MRIMSRDDAPSAPADRADSFSRVRADAKCLGQGVSQTSAAPSVVHDCDGLDSIANLVERIEGLVNNRIRISPTRCRSNGLRAWPLAAVAAAIGVRARGPDGRDSLSILLC